MLADITEALRQGDLAAALANARALAADEPQNAAAQHLLGVCLQRTRDLAAARRAFETALELAPDQASHHFSLATLELAEGNAPAAVRGLQQALALDPNQLGAYVMLAHLALSRGDADEAERQLKLAQRVNPGHPQVVVVEGYVAQARGDADRALNCFSAAAKADPGLAAAQLALGMAFLSRKMWPFAEQALGNALALDPSRAPSTLRALVEARRRQGKAAETLAALDELLQSQPQDLFGRTLRSEILAEAGEAERALDDLRVVLKAQPHHADTLQRATALMGRTGNLDEALARIETALGAVPGDDALWKVRLNVSGMIGEDAKDILDRWQDAMPDSLACLEMLAGYYQARGQDALAESYADRALAIQPELYGSNLIKLRAEIAEEPALALARAERLLAGARDAITQRTLLGWAGLALDALGRADEAAARWREMAMRVPPHQLPPPSVLPAAAGLAGDAEGLFLWSPPGVRAEYVLRTAKQQLGPRLRLDRIGSSGAGDGFGVVRFAPGHPEAGTAERWRQSLQALDLAPADTVDWLPHVDAYTFAALGDARWVALLVDPRDALLNWLVHGSLQNFLFAPDPQNAAGWLASTLEALADHRDLRGDRVTLVRLDRDAGKAEATLEHLLKLEQPLGALFGRGARFPAGHWREYRQAFAAEFERLAPVAARLGYPAD